MNPFPLDNVLDVRRPDSDALNRLSNPYGLILSPGDALQLSQARSQALSNTGRIELDDSSIEFIVAAFCSSPWILPEEFASALCELIELFYHLKNETNDRISDEALLRRMRELFDEPCHGSVEQLIDLLGRGLSCPD